MEQLLKNCMMIMRMAKDNKNMLLSWKKIKLWCFHHWRMLVIAAVIIFSYFYGRRKTAAYKTQLKMAQALYKKEIDALVNASDKKEDLKTKAELKYRRALEIAQESAMQSNNYAELKKAERVRELVELNKENPEEIDKILSREFGIILMTPEDKK